MSNSELIGSSTKFRAVFESVSLVAPGDSAVLIRANPAPASRVIAQAHEASSRRNNRFVPLNCAAIRFAGFAGFAGFPGSGLAGHRCFPLFSNTCKWQASCSFLDRSRDARRSRGNRRGNNEEYKMVCLPAELEALLNLRGPAPPERPHRGCPPQCAKPLHGCSEVDRFRGSAESRRRIEADFNCAEVDLLRDSRSSDRSALPDARCPLGGVRVRERGMK
jgi:Sigma-54 interaction domain